MLDFKEITLEDKAWVNDILKGCHKMSCEYCFGNLFICQRAYRERIVRIQDYFVVEMYRDEGEGGYSYLYPAGRGDIRPVIEGVIAHCREKGIPFCLHGASQEETQELEELYPGRFVFSANRNYSDYIYTVQDLTDLAGKKYHGKRNHIARFKKTDWSFEPITDRNFDECLEMNRKWCQINDCGRDESIKAERCAVRRSFAHFKELDFFGGVLRQEGKIVAYTIGERLNDDTVCVHMEKAFSEVEGAYPAINREFIANLCQSYTYVNREEDLGVEGLRKAKLSYRPVLLLDKYEVRLAQEFDG